MLKIAERLRPFSKRPGIRCLIPGSSIVVEVFPALVRFYEGSKKTLVLLKEIPLSIQGPLNQFVVFQDLERGCVTVLADRKTFHLLPTMEMSNKKNPPFLLGHSMERLSLGAHKKQEWETLHQKRDFHTLLPLWHRLGLLTKMPVNPLPETGIFSLLHSCEKTIFKNQPEKILPSFLPLFLAGFSDLFVPRLQDEEHQGIVFPIPSKDEDQPLYLLTYGAALIRALFFQKQGNRFLFLPALPPEFFAGRFLDVKTDVATISFEWSKKHLRSVFLHCHKDDEITLEVPHMHRFRRRSSLRDSGRIHQVEEGMIVRKGETIILDRFIK